MDSSYHMINQQTQSIALIAMFFQFFCVVLSCNRLRGRDRARSSEAFAATEESMSLEAFHQKITWEKWTGNGRAPRGDEVLICTSLDAMICRYATVLAFA